MKKEFIPCEQALELKELRYDEQYIACYTNEGELLLEETWKHRYSIKAPLYQQAFRWFREKYGLYSEIFVDDNKTFGFYITSFIEEGRLDKPITRQFNTYDKAQLGCVKQLIEIIDRKDEAYQ